MRPTPIEAARERHSLASVAARTGVESPRLTGSVTVRCPFPSHGHPDRTPSLRMHLDDGIFSCFGCGAWGDVVEWVRRTEGVDWREAIRILDDQRALTNAWAGSTAPPGARPAQSVSGSYGAQRPSGQAEPPDLGRTPAERVRQALEVAWGTYAAAPSHRRGTAYLLSRGIDVSVLEGYTQRTEVGHTPADPAGVVTALRAHGFTDDEAVDAGLARRPVGGGPMRDFYRGRVLIPLRDGEGRLCGFIGRAVAQRVSVAKYTNPPHTPVYNKSVNLYQPLPVPSGQTGQVVVVEGTLDAMAIAVAAIRAGRAEQFCSLTQSGRELSDTQLAYLVDLRPVPVVLGFDGDPAGRDSASRYALAAARRGRAVAVTVLPDDHDPASWLALRGDVGLAAWSVAERQSGEPPSPAPVAAASFLAHLRCGADGPRERTLGRGIATGDQRNGSSTAHADAGLVGL